MPLLLLLVIAGAALGQNPTPLWLRGYSVIPAPQVVKLEKEGARVFTELTAVYEKSRYPKGGPKFVHVLDDTKDHWADRTADMSFMSAPERSIGLDKWRAWKSKWGKLQLAPGLSPAWRAEARKARTQVRACTLKRALQADS